MNPFRLNPPAAPGRPRETTLTPAQETRYIQLVQLANKNRESGSASMAFRVLCDEFPEIGWKATDRASKHQLPACARELARRANALVPLHRQGERGLRSAGAYAPGGLRSQGTERLFAGARASWDDATVNFGVLVPWTGGGCELSERYKVKLGRFQLLLCHDEASSFVPAWSHVIREAQSYRGTDVCEAVMRVSRDVCLFENLVLEGGVWQGRRMARVMAGMGVKTISAKGRPQSKMVENYLNRLWTRLGLEPGLSSVGRFRGEEKETSELYVKCRAGKADPRGKFPLLEAAVNGMENAIRWLNADRIESRLYGKWVPAERWERDLAERPRPTLSPDALWLAAPVMEKRKVGRSGVSVSATGPLGLKMVYTFTGPCLWEWEGKEVEVYFDPLAEWPLTATACLPGSVKPLGQLECSNPYHQGGNPNAAKAVREVMRREYRVIWSGGALAVSRKESEIRTPEGTATIHRGETPAAPAPPPREAAAAPDFPRRSELDLLTVSDRRQPHELAAREPQTFNRGGVETPLATPAPDPLRRLAAKAAAAREAVPNW